MKNFLILTVWYLILEIQMVHNTDNGICPFENFKRKKRENEDNTQGICDLMKPRGGESVPETTPCPWKIYIYKAEIEQQHAQPVVIGSEDATSIFHGYIIAARQILPNDDLGIFLGHFEPQWDAIPHCCAGAVRPNMLDGSSHIRVQKPNQTLLWTAPNDYIGKFVFVTTIWKSMGQYWFQMRSPVVNIVKQRNHPNAMTGIKVNRNVKL